ncbi:nucleotidyltransferase domain-containing protein [Clostridium nigeriense]|uniref:nucleotidyltransferase domain-containing protein n=1 Tax=Clostridium nigeriense TaxID=1805470 RepID=UPI000837A0EB|nr:nucleotidyltransferase family protein [Clostridium nigeriense]
MLNILSYIGEFLNNENIRWAVGGSILLNQFGIIDSPNDIDILVDLKDINKVNDILKEIGKKKIYEKSKIYATKFFYEYEVNNIDVDVMAGLIIKHNEGEFNYTFDKESITKVVNINGVNIPFSSLEDWYIIYQLIPGREYKVSLIEDYFMIDGIKNSTLLERGLKEELPKEVKWRVEKLLNL